MADYSVKKQQDSFMYEPISVLGTAIEVCILVMLIMVFNQFPQWLRFWPAFGVSQASVPIFAPSFFDYVPLFNLVWGLSLGFAILKLVLRHWTPLLRWLEWGLMLLNLYVLWVIVTGGPILNPALLPGTVELILRMAMWIALVVSGISAVVRFLKLLMPA